MIQLKWPTLLILIFLKSLVILVPLFPKLDLSLKIIFLKCRNDAIYDFSLSFVTPERIIEAISSLETKSSLDIDNLNTKVLKKVSNFVSIPLAHICNVSFESGVLPSK